MSSANLPFLFSGDRQEISNVTLTPIAGTLPNNLYGYIYLMTQCGTVNSGGYPYPAKVDGKRNPEYGSPVLNGNGMIFMFDLSQPNEVKVSSQLVKTPSYYADEASKVGGESRKDFEHFHFSNAGISRMSFLLGSVNYANTALIPVQFKNDSGPSLLATYDTGRPIKIDPSTLEFVSPIGYNKEWLVGVPPFLTGPFPMFETTAHPSWDPVDKVLYAVNFTKSAATDNSRQYLYEILRKDKGSLKKDLKIIAQSFKNHGSKDKAVQDIYNAIEKRGKNIVTTKKKKKKRGFFGRILGSSLGWIEKWLLSWLGNKIEAATKTIDEVRLVRFDGSGALQTWKLVDEKEESLVIYQCMHQTSISEHYILLMDSSFKFSFDLLINNPFPHEPEIDELIRILGSKTILPSTQVWIIKKSDLGSSDTVVARAVSGQPIEGLTNKPYGGVPMECVHFSTDYDDTNDQITIYTAHNNAMCLAEWIRPYDINFFTKEAYNASTISNYAAGQLALSSIGKYVINGTTAAFVPEECTIIKEEGNLPPIENLDGKPLKNIGPNTWGIGLYAYRDMISPTNPGSKIKQLYFVNFGTQPELLSQFIYDLYKEVPNRKLTLEQIEAYTKCGIPQSIMRIDTASMTMADHYEVDWGVFPMSVQFIPMKTPSTTIPPDQDGYIWLTVKQLTQQGNNFVYQSQVWLFEAWQLSNGPICKLAADDFNFCTSLHITWLETAQAITTDYKVDIEKDFTESIDNSFLEVIEKEKYQDFFKTYVYPHFQLDEK